MPSCTEKKSPPQPSGLLTVFAIVGALTLLSYCTSAPPAAPAEEFRLPGRWTIEYGRSARSILEARGLGTDAARSNVAEMQLKKNFYGEFHFAETGTYSLLYRVQGKDKKDNGIFTIREHQGRRFLLAARSQATEAAGGSSAEETFTIEFIEADLIRLQKQDEKDLPPLIFQREEVKP